VSGPTARGRLAERLAAAAVRVASTLVVMATVFVLMLPLLIPPAALVVLVIWVL
jgi:hypothetical protein